MKNNDLSMKMVYYKKTLKMTNEMIASKTGLPVGTVSRIASGITKSPTLKTLRLIADAFNCTVDDLAGNEDSIEPYYFNQETAQLAQQIRDNHDLKILLDASRDLPPEDLRAIIDIANRLKKTN